MDIEYYVEPVFKIEFLKLKVNEFKNKKKRIEKVLKNFPEVGNDYFYSNRDKGDFTNELAEILGDEFNFMSKSYNSKIDLQNAWSVTYGKGHYHVPHNHGAEGYAGILYLDINPEHAPTTYIQPWNDDRGKSVLFKPEVEEGDIVIAPKFITHYSEPNKITDLKRIVGFDFNLV